ncbi:MAG: AAA family ATPase, partial [Spirochaetaceae bacterium]|nr:AAA family ATPase [Spirochaetaceae bacterium]
MRLETITLSGFRCFGPNPLTVRLAAEITAVVGPNAAGKTALLHGLAKLFGVSRAQRTVLRSDFHLAPGIDPDSRDPRDLFIDVLIGLPELVDKTATPETIAPSFRHMRLERAGEAPVCRLRLEARWEDDGTLEGEVSQELFWVDTLEAIPTDDQRHPVSASDRGLIQLYYTPASRDAEAQIRATTGALAARLLRAIEWSSETQDAVNEASESLGDAFEGEDAIAAISKALSERWSDLHDEAVDTKPKLSLVSRRFEEVVSRIAVIFEQGPDGRERGLDALSDGQQSLFYFALAAAVFDLERQVVAGEVDGFRDDELRIPALTIFALEEPENHLSPYFLARIIRQVRSLTDEGGAQAIVTSHSPAVLSRVRPREVRYCRCDPKTRQSSVKSIKMPTDDAEAAKFVRGAMLAYPELYFARFVLLVEGDSERIVLPRLAEALDLLIDPAFVAIVP